MSGSIRLLATVMPLTLHQFTHATLMSGSYCLIVAVMPRALTLQQFTYATLMSGSYRLLVAVMPLTPQQFTHATLQIGQL
jgi:hypothetical protein